MLAYGESVLACDRGELATAARWDALPDLSVFSGRRFAAVTVLIDRVKVRRSVGDQAGAREALVLAQVEVDHLVDPGGLATALAAERRALEELSGGTGPPPVSIDPRDALSRREIEVLRLLRSEYSLPEIAGRLFMSYNTAKTHTRTIYRKLGVTSRSAAVGRARELGYLDRQPHEP